MADIPTPTPPAPISGYRSRAINAAVEYTTATRPIAGGGVIITDGPGGKTISVESRGLAQRAAPWVVRAYPAPFSDTAVEWKIRVFGGMAVLNGAELNPPESADGVDVATGLSWYNAPEIDAESQYLCVKHDGEGAWVLSWEKSSVGGNDGEEYRAIARLDAEGPPPRLTQLDVGVVDIGDSGHHFGDAEDAETRAEWEQTEEVPAILDLDNATRYKLLVDSRGNIISWTSGEEGEEPETPSNPHAPPPTCGNPLNDPVSDNPLDDPVAVGGGGGGGGGGDDGTGNPLDYEGDGGYTPECSP